MIGRRKSSLRKYNFDYDQQKKLINSLFSSQKIIDEQNELIFEVNNEFSGMRPSDFTHDISEIVEEK